MSTVGKPPPSNFTPEQQQALADLAAEEESQKQKGAESALQATAQLAQIPPFGPKKGSDANPGGGIND